MTYEFPANFQWGAATAAAQIEGAGSEGGKGPSIWDTLCATPGAIVDGSDIQVACDHYHRYRDDVALIKDLGLGTYRFSVSWARVMPDGRTLNEEGLDFYERLVDELLAAGIKPWLTLYHWDLPQALQDEGGWTNRQTSELFARYASAVYERLGSKVRTWTTLNEPWCSSFLSYAAGEHAPGHTEPAESVAAVHHLLLAHGLAAAELRAAAEQRGTDLQLGITLNPTVFHPSDPNSAGDIDAARRLDGLSNRIFCDPLFKGEYPADVVEDLRDVADLMALVHDGDLEAISAPIDVLGVNFYNGHEVQAADPADDSPLTRINEQGRARRSPNVGSERVRGVSRGLPLTAMGWEVQADDLRQLLLRLHRDYTGPAGTALAITENGAAYDDRPDADGFVDDTADRLAYIRQHLIAVHQAIQEGARVEAYLVWSLLDNFEWAFGYTKRFGVVAVNFDTQVRTPKASALWLREVATANAVLS